MNIPDGAKFLFFVVPVFVVSIILIMVFLNKNDDKTPIDNEENLEEQIFGSENTDDMDFEEFKVETTEEGSGKEADNGDEVSVHYNLSLKDGTKIESSYDGGEPFTFVLGIGQVIQGWELGIVGMKEGEKRLLEIPSDLGYGSTGSGRIPGNTGLIFETELISIN